MRSLAITLLIATACGRIGFNPTALWVLDGNPGSQDGNGSNGGSDASGANPTARTWVKQGWSTRPTALAGPKLVYDSARKSVIFYGGDQNSDVPSAEMWEYTAAGWNQLCSSCAPGPRSQHAMTYDSARDRVILYGGSSVGGEPDAESSDLWEWNGTNWNKVTQAGALPGARGGHGLEYDASRNRTVLIGGYDGGGYTADVYEYDGATWTHPTPASTPSNIWDLAQITAYDSAQHRVLVQTMSNDVWSWDGASWAKQCTGCSGTSASLIFDPIVYSAMRIGDANDDGSWQVPSGTLVSTAPPVRDSIGIAFDVNRDVIVLVGGNGNSCGLVMGTTQNCDETWEMVGN